MNTALVRYDAMCHAIDNAYAVDEVKDIRDKAVAFEAYARQAKNTEAERRACEIRLRAERKAGKLLSTMDKNPGGNPVDARDRGKTPSTLSDLGISRDQSSRWQQLADVPEGDFEAALAAPEKPSTNGILAGKKAPMDSRALWLWGRLRDFERDGLLDENPQTILSEMTDAMQADVRRLAQPVTDWLKGITDE